MRLRDVPIPEGAEERAWEVVRTAFGEREPVSWPRRHARPLVAVACVVAVGALAASPPGLAVLGSLRKAIGKEKVVAAKHELFRLPAPGRLLVVSREGAWVVRADGSRRLLGRYLDAAWSPHGLYLAATRRNELLAVDPKGNVRWALPRPKVAFPRWVGSRTDTRIAYLTTSRLHLVAGDGTGDIDLCGEPAAAGVAPAWRPGPGRVLAYATTRGRVYLVDADHCSVAWATPAGPPFVRLDWSSDGRQLLAARRDRVTVYLASGRRWTEIVIPRGLSVADAAFEPGTHHFAYAVRSAARTQIMLFHGGSRPLFAGAGTIDRIVWSPDGAWLLASWPDADEWLFIRATKTPKLVAVANIVGQFGADPRIAGWCCAG